MLFLPDPDTHPRSAFCSNQRSPGRSLLLSLLSLLCSFSLYSQNYTPVKNLAEFKTLYTAKSAKITSLMCDFEQNKKITLMEKKLVSRGKFMFKKTNKLRMEYTKPFEYIFILNGDKITIRNDQKENNYSTRSNKMFSMISQLTMDCVTGDVVNSKDFEVSVLENAQMYEFLLKPKVKAIKSLIVVIEVLISKSDFTVDRIDMKEESGDNTLLIFSNKRINPSIGDEEFKLN
jgi:outer membrane lipoprotein-sorting protein